MSAQRDRELERWLLGEAGPELRGQVHERARLDDGVRAVYDDYFSVLRALEDDGGLESAGEPRLDTPSEVEREWLEAEFFGGWETAEPSWSERLLRAKGWLRWPRPLALASALAALLFALWLGQRAEQAAGPGSRVAVVPAGEAGLIARGRGRSAEVEVELFCGTPAAPVNDGRCGLDQQLTFAVRATSLQPAPRQLTLFGVDGSGAVQYYAPTPAEPQGVLVESDRWQPTPFSVQLAVNHRAGAVQIYALLGPRVASVEEVDAMATQLAGPSAKNPPSAKHESWLHAVEDSVPQPVKALCPNADACEAVQTQIWLYSPETAP